MNEGRQNSFFPHLIYPFFFKKKLHTIWHHEVSIDTIKKRRWNVRAKKRGFREERSITRVRLLVQRMDSSKLL